MAFHIPDAWRDRYDPVQASEMAGWVDRAFFESLGPEARSDPRSLARQPGAERIKDSRNMLARIPWGDKGRHVWLKAFRPEGTLDRAVRCLRLGKVERAWNTAMCLLEAGIDTPRPLLGLRPKGRLGSAHGLLIVEEALRAEQLRAALRRCGAGTKERQELIAGLGAFLSRLHSAGFWHRDLSGGNVLLTRDEAGALRFTLVDVNRMRRAGSIGDHQRLRDLERIRLDKTDDEGFFGAYCPSKAEELANRRRERAARYRLMREADSGWARVVHKARYYWDDLWG